MDIMLQSIYRQLFQMDQLTAKIAGAASLELLLAEKGVETQPHETIGHKCLVKIPLLAAGHWKNLAQAARYGMKRTEGNVNPEKAFM
jgi:hypothetical protein